MLTEKLDKKKLLKHLTGLVKIYAEYEKIEQYDWNKVYYAGRKDSLFLLKRAIEIGGFKDD